MASKAWAKPDLRLKPDQAAGFRRRRLRFTLISRFSANAPPIRQRHYGYALYSWQSLKFHIEVSRTACAFTLNRLHHPCKTHRPIRVASAVRSGPEEQ